jgi:hypothetical protein
MTCASPPVPGRHRPARIRRRLLIALARAQALPARVAKLAATPGASVGGEALLEHDAVVAFYQARRNQPAWDLGAGAASIREAITGIAQDGLEPSDYHLARIER